MGEEEKEQTIEEAIDKAWNELFDLISKRHDSLYELKILYQEVSTGKTIVRSWHDSQERLRENELNSQKMAPPRK